MRKILADLQVIQIDLSKVFVDNQVAVTISNIVFYGKTEHSNYFLKEVWKEEEFSLQCYKREE